MYSEPKVFESSQATNTAQDTTKSANEKQTLHVPTENEKLPNLHFISTERYILLNKRKSKKKTISCFFFGWEWSFVELSVLESVLSEEEEEVEEENDKNDYYYDNNDEMKNVEKENIINEVAKGIEKTQQSELYSEKEEDNAIAKALTEYDNIPRIIKDFVDDSTLSSKNENLWEEDEAERPSGKERVENAVTIELKDENKNANENEKEETDSDTASDASDISSASSFLAKIEQSIKNIESQVMLQSQKALTNEVNSGNDTIPNVKQLIQYNGQKRDLGMDILPTATFLGEDRQVSIEFDKVNTDELESPIHSNHDLLDIFAVSNVNNDSHNSNDNNNNNNNNNNNKTPSIEPGKEFDILSLFDTPPDQPHVKYPPKQPYSLEQSLKDALFDPLYTPPQSPIYSSLSEPPQLKQQQQVALSVSPTRRDKSAGKIQRQWKMFQFKTLLVKLLNRRIDESLGQNVYNNGNSNSLSMTNIIATTAKEVTTIAQTLQTDASAVSHYRHDQFHFTGSPALQYDVVYSMLESIVLRNCLYFNVDIHEMIQEIFRLQSRIDDYPNKGRPQDHAMTEQYKHKVIEMKTKLFTSLQELMEQNPGMIRRIQLFPKQMQHNLFHSPNVAHAISHDSSLLLSSPTPTDLCPNNNNNNNAPSLYEIRNKLKLLRQSFSVLGRDMCMCVCVLTHSQTKQSKGKAGHLKLTPHSRSPWKEANDRDDMSEMTDDGSYRPQTAPVSFEPKDVEEHALQDATTAATMTTASKRKHKMIQNYKVDWSHVKPKTVSYLPDNLRSKKPNKKIVTKKVCWNQVQSRVDCGQSILSSAHSFSHKSDECNNNGSKLGHHFEEEFEDGSVSKSYSYDIYKPNTQASKPITHSLIPKTHKFEKEEDLFYFGMNNQVRRISREKVKKQLLLDAPDSAGRPHVVQDYSQAKRIHPKIKSSYSLSESPSNVVLSGTLAKLFPASVFAFIYL
ncbi:hypothetical protein RFI_22324 [Reticulomyxa filosa]|uniref:Uncharacterized protein n=1 Tax=Reticulomyxa filosa TaxID=46433 RepID=X6MN01_RETFI|nr:hypothetical protein RFI_22324 [Reticulomyxa filosa]|eukprot:ETO15041.1 hypothetical protein RFI_22324 [Reticulomyxa filosa]